MSSLPPVCLFDLDGTLVDTNYLHTAAWAGALREAGHVVPTAWVHHRIGMGGDQLLTELIGPDGHDAVKAGWRERFRALRHQAVAFAGAGELIGERRHGSFSRQLFLGDTLDTERIDARYLDGVLTVEIPVAERARPRKIDIATGAPAIEASADELTAAAN